MLLPTTRDYMQANSVVLLLIPYIIHYSGSPWGQHMPQHILELVVEPSLAAFCFIWAKCML